MTDLTRTQLDRLRDVAAVLLPGTDDMPAALDLADYDALLAQAARALGKEFPAICAGIATLPKSITAQTLDAYQTRQPGAFELVSLVVVGSYFISDQVKASMRLPVEPRQAPSMFQIADELDLGIIDAVMERASPIRTLEQVNNART